MIATMLAKGGRCAANRLRHKAPREVERRWLYTSVKLVSVSDKANFINTWPDSLSLPLLQVRRTGLSMQPLDTHILQTHTCSSRRLPRGFQALPRCVACAGVPQFKGTGCRDVATIHYLVQEDHCRRRWMIPRMVDVEMYTRRMQGGAGL